MLCSAQNWLRASCPDIITKDQWPPNSSNINPMDYHVWGAMLEAYCKLKTKLKTSAKLKEALQVNWDNLPQGCQLSFACQLNRPTKICRKSCKNQLIEFLGKIGFLERVLSSMILSHNSYILVNKFCLCCCADCLQ